MRKMRGAAAICLGGAFVWTGVVRAQFGRGGSDWMTVGGDAQRSSWVRADPKISKAAMQKPGFAFLWKVKLKNDARGMTALTAPALLDRYIGYRGFRTLGFVGGSSDQVFALDTDLGRLEWSKPVSSVTPAAGQLRRDDGQCDAAHDRRLSAGTAQGRPRRRGASRRPFRRG